MSDDNRTIRTSGIILAGGKSRRFNVNETTPLHKGLSVLQGKPLILHVMEKIQKVCDEILVVVNSEMVKRSFSNIFRDLLATTEELIMKVKIVVDEPLDAVGPLRGVLTGLKHSRGEIMVTSACDTLYHPKIPKVMIDTLKYRDVFLVVPQNPDGHLEPTLLGMKITTHVKSLIFSLQKVKRGRLTDIIRLTSRVGVITLHEPVLNINTREQLRHLMIKEELNDFLELITPSEVRVVYLTSVAWFEAFLHHFQNGELEKAMTCLEKELDAIKSSPLSTLEHHVAKDLSFLKLMMNKRARI